MTAIYPLRRSSAVQRDLLNPAARLGLTARALMYLLIGVLSILVAAGHSTAETDQWGAMQQLNRELVRPPAALGRRAWGWPAIPCGDSANPSSAWRGKARKWVRD